MSDIEALLRAKETPESKPVCDVMRLFIADSRAMEAERATWQSSLQRAHDQRDSADKERRAMRQERDQWREKFEATQSEEMKKETQ